ncbi:binding-protein-dependent transporter system inner membrane protein [Thauera linaloolentis 47Lol = DSM 12138]|uniref:Binding-protein-dependent transporter system inner membrane protein n=1 Tax=Thauera linaloolentis (strain DSM 12138 / JCM 21573 / CCUG 41526 / CIP 105981 / IAM 15112 / NBRC 102519 / 47Lol) TaxID=1123367 RepID=N6YGW4_THAL4|nr:methionine ABC transporter permease [Thauera linaloolentis]ENO90740.1 binding-protein-dependent transporter system inner membrane protein [Thauera linaloolentis 47Lol = DSM 12138]
MIDLSMIEWGDIAFATWETLVMTGVSLFFTILFGLPLGILLFVTSNGQLLERRGLYRVLSFIVNVLRSVPFLILLIVMIPVTVILIGTSLGVEGAIPPLVVATAPFFARLVENVLREIDRGIIEACQSMGIRTHRIIFGALLPEALPGLIAATTVTAITLISYAAMSGVIGGGGLGDLAIRFGYQRFQTEVMVITVALLVVLVQLIQHAGDRLVLHFTRK